VDVGPLSMNLNGMIDAAVNGGTLKYLSAFLGPEYLKNTPKDADKVQFLKDVLREQLEDLDHGLKVCLATSNLAHPSHSLHSLHSLHSPHC
jgi:hypothetical protein